MVEYSSNKWTPSGKKASKHTVLGSSGKTRHPPIHMNVKNLFTKVGEAAPANPMKASAWQDKTCKKTTEAGRRIEKGMGSEPLGCPGEGH